MKTSNQAQRQPLQLAIRLRHSLATTINPIINPFHHL